jgi:hypothetical protein
VSADRIVPRTQQGRIQDFKLGRGGAHLKKLRRAEGGAKIFGVFRVKNTILRQKIIFFQILGTPPGSAHDLEYLQTNDDGKSSVHLSAILRFDFFLPLVVCSHILHTVVPITVPLQSSRTS